MYTYIFHIVIYIYIYIYIYIDIHVFVNTLSSNKTLLVSDNLFSYPTKLHDRAHGKKRKRLD